MLLYTLGIRFYHTAAKVISPFNTKAKLFSQGRKNLFERIKEKVNPDNHNVWFHVASLGEFEQGRPVMEEIKKRNPEVKIILTFFSPSGYEIRKNYAGADAIFYMPEDTPSSAAKFLDSVNPKAVYFVKYDFWYNILNEVHRRGIPLYIFSSIFKENQIFFKFYGVKYRKILKFFTRIFVQDQNSIDLLKSHGIDLCLTAGDTRFDRVCQITQNSKDIPVAENFAADKPVIVAGSTWPPDEKILFNIAPELNSEFGVKFIVAPHEIHESHLAQIEKLSTLKTVRFSKVKPDDDLTDIQVLIIDNIGMLSSLYRYGKIAYIGGGFGVGIHNTLEAVSYAIPVAFGPNYKKFKEACDLINRGGAFSITNDEELNTIFTSLLSDPDALKKAGDISLAYVNQNLGATDIILSNSAY